MLQAFGVIEPKRVLAQDDLFAVGRDKFPATPGYAQGEKILQAPGLTCDAQAHGGEVERN